MVFVNDKKFACESCIKGHRSSSCAHTDRPLFEIKKKGRPVSQCETCRELRKTKRMHNKCTCGTSPHETLPTGFATTSGLVQPFSSTENPAKKTMYKPRFKPIAPALPNGLRDIHAAQAGPSAAPDPRARVDTLLNPCHCKSVWDCRCRSASTPNADGLAALAQAAEFCCSQDAAALADKLDAPGGVSGKRTRDCCAPPSPPLSLRTKRHRHAPPHPHPHSHSHSHSHSHTCLHAHDDHSARGPELPPLVLTSPPASSTQSTPLSTFPPIPPLSSIMSLAADGCCCGLRCACPGCVEHRGRADAAPDVADCADGCGTCVDHAQVELSASSGSIQAQVQRSAEEKTPGQSQNFLNAFLARAAAIPPPPRAFGVPVVLPPLECGCAGGCGCPEGKCECGDGCTGCGVDSDEGAEDGPRGAAEVMFGTADALGPAACEVPGLGS
ncbi:hypothetical protein CERSUDRAFT_109864 [Gelatoporia subvermispora B]|uniref:Copper-fist domain-containing protein n=1 Tax=Ceriporiopsis subvermispora (strain B) TaxID=914234 RepID=M2RQT6_CERS8|nr:hypothetical protein CERSUDRAFT_109864 [Gelatoporia subvermispora B]